MATGNRGLSLHIGVKRVDSSKYHDREGNPWDGALGPCEADAKDMAALAQANGFVPKLLLTSEATADRILEGIRAAAAELKSGDIFLLTFSGHGGRVPDENGEEQDSMDETWVAYDRQLVDDELYQELTRFARGVRVLVVTDSCHSGTMARQIPPSRENAKVLDQGVEDNDYLERAELYSTIQKTVPDNKTSAKHLQASVVLFSACQDEEFAYVGARHSIFTGVVLNTWDEGRFQGSYLDFYNAVAATLEGSKQTPNWFPPGEEDPEFFAQRPFTI